MCRTSVWGNMRVSQRPIHYNTTAVISIFLKQCLPIHGRDRLTLATFCVLHKGKRKPQLSDWERESSLFRHFLEHFRVPELFTLFSPHQKNEQFVRSAELSTAFPRQIRFPFTFLHVLNFSLFNKHWTDFISRSQ